MQLYVSDYLGDTRALTTEQHGAYLLLLMAAWNAGGRLPNDPRKLARFTGCTPSRWARIGADVLAYFEADGEELVNRRLSSEWQKAAEKSNQRAVSGAKGGNAKALKSKETDVANAIDLLCHSPEPDTIKKDTTDKPVVARKPRGSRRCPEEWTVPPELMVELTVAGYVSGQLERELSRFRAWTFKSGRVDWPDTFRSWMENKRPERTHQDERSARQSPGVEKLQSIDAAMVEAVRRRLVCSDSDRDF